MMRRYIKRSMEWLHVVLILSMLAPLICMADSQMEPDQIYRTYFAGYLLIVPVVGLMQAERGCKNFIQYLAVFLCMCFFVKIAAQRLGELLLIERAALVYTVCMNICTVLIAAGAFATRMYKIRRKEARENQDNTWKEDGFILDKPGKGFSLIFVVIYISGLFCTCPPICNLALYSTLVYLLLASAHKYIDELEEYLKLNENMYQVRNIPYKRIYGIGKLFIIGYLVLLFLTVVPAFLTADDRRYIEIQHVLFQREIEAEDIYVQPPVNITSEPMLSEMRAESTIFQEILHTLNTLLYIISVITCVVILFAAIAAIRKELARFAKSSEEENDVVESLEPVNEAKQIIMEKRMWKRTEEDKIRRLYRKFIRKHRKELPAAYETPTEIELAAGVTGTEEGKVMHEKYEQVRYAKLRNELVTPKTLPW